MNRRVKPAPSAPAGPAMTALDWLPAALDMVNPAIKPPIRFATPGELAKAIDPETRQTPALDLIDQALVDVEEGRCDRLIITMPPQEGKSTRVTKQGALWFLLRNSRRKIIIASYATELANEFGRDIRSYITSNSGQDGTLDLGLRIAPDNGSVRNWKLWGHRGGVLSVGLRAGVTGRPGDVLFIDDPIANREQAESEAHRRMAENFYRTTATTRLAPGAAVIVILTRWHQLDLAGYLLSREDSHRWRVLNIPAQADYDPNKGEVDVLGRQPGEYMLSARVNERTGKPRGPAEWEEIKVEKGALDWNALYQGRPSPEAGNVLRGEWWKFYAEPMWVVREDGTHMVPGSVHDDSEIVQSWDMTFKDTKGSDYVVGQVWLRRGVDIFLLDQVRGRWSFAETCAQLLRLSAKWPQATAKLIEDKANGPAVMNALRAQIGGMIPVEPEGSKYARAAAMSPFVQAGNCWLPGPKLAPWVGDFVEEAKAFPNGAHDDQVDGFSQAGHRLILVPILNGDWVTSDDFLDADPDEIDFEYEAAAISRY